MKQVYNFSAGPAVLPKSALIKAQNEMLSYQDSQMSVLELSHRGELFEGILAETKSLLKELMNIPDNYQILFLQGGASLQFYMIPLNFAKKKIGFIDTGVWSSKAIEEANKMNKYDVEVIETSKDSNFSELPEVANIPSDLDYLHITTNNTIEGTTFFNVPKTDVPIVADMSSNILSSQYDVNDFSLIYAGAQKNLGPAGVTLVIVKDEFLETINKDLPSMLDYNVFVKNDSLYNTPPTFSIYMMKLVLEWLKELGGVKAIEALNIKKAKVLYDYLDQSKLFYNPVKVSDRSLTNVPFLSKDDEINKQFIKEATALGFENLKGHRLVGGMRASIYNAFPYEGVVALVDFMQEFEKKVGV